MNRWEIALSVVLSLLVNEVTDISPWIARKLVRWSAYRWTTDPEAAAGYAEEWAALIDDQPGKLIKLLTAVRFCLGAAGRAVPRLARVIQANILLIPNVRKARSLYQLIRALLAGTGGGKGNELYLVISHDMLAKGVEGRDYKTDDFDLIVGNRVIEVKNWRKRRRLWLPEK